jgi:hypothetical protein
MASEVAKDLTDLARACRASLEALVEPHATDPWGDAEDLAEVWAAVKELAATVGMISDEAEQRLIQAQAVAHGKVHTYKHVGTLEIVSSSKKTTWDHERLLGVVIKTAMDNRDIDDDGQIIAPEVAIERMLAEVAAFAYWRLGALEQHGIDGHDFRVTEYGRKRIKKTG